MMPGFSYRSSSAMQIPGDVFWQSISEECVQLRAEIRNLENKNSQLRSSIRMLQSHADDLGIDFPALLKQYNLDFSHEAAFSNSILASSVVKNSDEMSRTVEQPFHHYQEIAPHEAAIYCGRFSPCGRFLGSGSFDKTVALWDVLHGRKQKFKATHASSVVDLCWSSDSSLVVSASLDSSAIVWDVNEGSPCSAPFFGKGMLLSVKFHPTDSNLFIASDSREYISMFDRRQPKNQAILLQNESIVNSIDMITTSTGVFLCSGDKKGFLRVWDFRKLQLSFSQSSFPTVASPVNQCHDMANVQTPSPGDSGTAFGDDSSGCCCEAHNLSIYSEHKRKGLPTSISSLSISMLHDQNVLVVNCSNECIHILRSDDSKAHLAFRNHLTIPEAFSDAKFGVRSAFYIGKKCQRTLSSEHDSQTSPSSTSVDSSMLIATGSADHCVYLYDLSHGGKLLQKIPQAHAGVIYGVAFHPVDPILATFSSDATIRLWVSRDDKTTFQSREH